jgi:hypothetical protein
LARLELDLIKMPSTPALFVMLVVTVTAFTVSIVNLLPDEIDKALAVS